MRTLILSALLATSVAMPAVAQDRDFRQRDRGVQEVGEARDEARAARRAERAVRVEATHAERPERVERQMQHVDHQITVAAPIQSDSHSSSGHQTYHRDARREHGALHASDPTRREHRGYHRDVTRDHRTEHRSWDRDSRRGGHGEYHRDANREHGELHASDPTRREHRGWHRDVTRQHDRRHSAWDTSWRDNRSYDWRGYRGRYSSLYNLSNYYDPYRDGYRRFLIGFSLSPSYYDSRYWLNDPGQYRLPPAYGPYRWVRYYDDALLVNIYTGQVVDVVHSFFW